MVVVGSDSAVIKEVATASESILSARRAVAEIGFNETLGSLNVYFGTDLHKRWIKETYGAWWARQPHDAPSGLRDEIRPLWRSLDRSLERERAASLRAADLFGLARATVLRCQVERLLGAPVLEAAGDAAFISAFMSFQDRIEDATAKAAVLPRTLSLPLVLWPVARMRRKLTRRLAAAIACAERGADPATLGSWLRAAATLPGELARRPSAQVAELAIGLLFASHKNPSIGAAQTLCALLELGDTHPTVRTRGGVWSARRAEGCTATLAGPRPCLIGKQAGRVAGRRGAGGLPHDPALRARDAPALRARHRGGADRRRAGRLRARWSLLGGARRDHRFGTRGSAPVDRGVGRRRRRLPSVAARVWRGGRAGIAAQRVRVHHLQPGAAHVSWRAAGVAHDGAARGALPHKGRGARRPVAARLVRARDAGAARAGGGDPVCEVKFLCVTCEY